MRLLTLCRWCPRPASATLRYWPIKDDPREEFVPVCDEHGRQLVETIAVTGIKWTWGSP